MGLQGTELALPIALQLEIRGQEIGGQRQAALAPQAGGVERRRLGREAELLRSPFERRQPGQIGAGSVGRRERAGAARPAPAREGEPVPG